MRRAKLYRTAKTPFGVFGQLELPGGGMLRTLERLWDDNRPGQSCIPPAPGETAVYPVRRDRTGKFTYFRIEDVPGRELIEIHPGNSREDSIGCILPGLRLGVMGDEWIVADSRRACERMLEHFGDEDWELEITWSFQV